MLKKIIIFYLIALTSLFAKHPLENDGNDICVIAMNALLNSNTDLNSENYQTYEWFAKQFYEEEFNSIQYDEFKKHAFYDKLKQEVPNVRKFLKEKYDDMFNAGMFNYVDSGRKLVEYSTQIEKAVPNQKNYDFEKNAFILELASPKKGISGNDFPFEFNFVNEENCKAKIKLSFANAPILLSLSASRNEASDLLKSDLSSVYFIQYTIIDNKLDKLDLKYGYINATVNAQITRVILLGVKYHGTTIFDIYNTDVQEIASWDIK